MEVTKETKIKIKVNHDFVAEAIIAKVVHEKGFALTPENTELIFSMSATGAGRLATTVLTSIKESRL